MKNLVITSVLLLYIGTFYGQYSGQIASNISSGGASQGNAAGMISTLLGPVQEAINKRKFSAENFQGSPYLSNKFQSTTLFYKKEKIGDLFYRYNAFGGEVEIKQSNLEEEGIRALSRDKSIAIFVDGKKMSFKTFVDKKEKTTNGYLITLLDGETHSLFKRINIKYNEGQAAQNSFVPAVPNKFSRFTEYYFQKKGVNRIDEIPLSNKKFVRLLDDAEEKSKMKAYLKDNNLSVKNEADLIKAYQYLNM